MARDRRGRFTAERTTETVTTETIVTERVTVEEPAPPPMALPDDPAPVFARLIRHPPADARWAHPDFIADEAARAAAQAVPVPPAPFTGAAPDTAPVAVITVPRVYDELAPAALAHEFTELDSYELRWALTQDGDPLP